MAFSTHSRQRSLAAFILALATTLFCGRAQADVSEQAYEDIKGVIEELITTEFAEGTTAYAACHSGQLPRYYVKSLQRMLTRQWGALGTALREDTINAVSDYVYLASSSGIQGDGRLLSLKDFIHQPLVRGGASKDEMSDVQAACRSINDSDHHEAHRHSVIEAVRKAGAPELLVEKCGDASASNERAACALAQSLRAALQGKEKQAQAKLMAFVLVAFRANSTFNLPAGLEDRILSGVVSWLAGDKDTQSVDIVIKEVGDSLRSSTPQSLFACSQPLSDGSTDDTKSVAEVLSKVALSGAKESAQAVACAGTRTDAIVLPDATVSVGPDAYRLNLDGFAESLGTLAKTELLATSAKTDSTSPLDLGRAILCSVVAKDGALLVPCKDKLPKEIEGRLTIGGLSWSIAAKTDGTTVVKSLNDSNGQLSPSLEAIIQAAVKVRSLTTAVDRAIRPFVTTTVKNRRELVRLSLRLGELLHDLPELKIFTGEGNFDFTTMLASVTRLVSTSALLCQSADADCSVISKVAQSIARSEGQLHDIAVSANRKDLRQLAYQTLELAFRYGGGERSLDITAECDVDNPPYAAVVLSFSSYLLNDVGNQSEKTLNKEALRTTAVRALQCASLGGLNRSWKTSDSNAKAAGIFLAHAAFRGASIRPSWNSAYINQLGGDGYRTAISLNGINYHARLTNDGSFAYAGLELSAIDYLAPLNELALRNNEPEYENEEGLWLEIIKPRIDVMFGLPQISEHLGASAGVALRTNVPFRGAPGQQAPGTATPNTFTYLPIWSDDDRVERNRAGFFELNVGVHYVF